MKTDNKTPLEKMSTAASIDGKEITDRLGRKIVLRKANIMDRYQLFKAMGADANSSALVAMMLPTIYVAAIDSSPCPTPRTLFEAEVSLKRLGDDGHNAVMDELNEFFDSQEKEIKENVKK